MLILQIAPILPKLFLFKVSLKHLCMTVGRVCLKHFRILLNLNASFVAPHYFRNLLPVSPKISNSIDKSLVLLVLKRPLFVLKDWKNVSTEHFWAQRNLLHENLSPMANLLVCFSAYCLWNFLPFLPVLSNSFYKSPVFFICPTLMKCVGFGLRKRLGWQTVFSCFFQISLFHLAFIRSRLKLWRNLFVEFALRHWIRSCTFTFKSFFRHEFFERW